MEILIEEIPSEHIFRLSFKVEWISKRSSEDSRKVNKGQIRAIWRINVDSYWIIRDISFVPHFIHQARDFIENLLKFVILFISFLWEFCIRPWILSFTFSSYNR